jgi:hypothetical protein
MIGDLDFEKHVHSKQGRDKLARDTGDPWSVFHKIMQKKLKGKLEVTKDYSKFNETVFTSCMDPVPVNKSSSTGASTKKDKKLPVYEKKDMGDIFAERRASRVQKDVKKKERGSKVRVFSKLYESAAYCLRFIEETYGTIEESGKGDRVNKGEGGCGNNDTGDDKENGGDGKNDGGEGDNDDSSGEEIHDVSPYRGIDWFIEDLTKDAKKMEASLSDRQLFLRGALVSSTGLHRILKANFMFATNEAKDYHLQLDEIEEHVRTHFPHKEDAEKVLQNIQSGYRVAFVSDDKCTINAGEEDETKLAADGYGKEFFEKKIEITGGIMLIGIGLKILISQMIAG